MQLHSTGQAHRTQAATLERERRQPTAKYPLPILHPKDAKTPRPVRDGAHTSVCDCLPKNSDSVPGLAGYEDKQDLHNPEKHERERNSTPSIEASGASDSDLGGVASSKNGYPEELDKSHTEEERPLEVACPSFFAVAGRCECNHHFARETYCGREWCPICGAKGSGIHDRRKARWYPKLQQCREVGYMVVTVPPEKREDYRSKQTLAKLGKAVKRLLCRNGIERGVRRWHFFGDVEGDQVPEYHPHLNALVDHGYIEPERLERIKRGLATILGVSVDRVNLHYEYTSEVPLILHWIKYVTRATFLDWRWDEGLARELLGFRNATPWGKWNGEKVWDVPARPESSDSESCAEVRQIADLEENRCPFDGSPIVWKGYVLRDKLTHPTERKWYKLGGGYWAKGGG